MKTLLATLLIAMMGTALTPALNAATAQERPQVKCPGADCSKICCKKSDKNRMVCSTGDCKVKAEKKDDHGGHKH